MTGTTTGVVNSIITGLVTGLGNPATTIPLIVDTIARLITDLSARGQVSDAQMRALQQRIVDVTARFERIPPFTPAPPGTTIIPQ